MSARPFRTRRSHQKSRHGCAECKRRRIKCDETTPVCTNCGNRGQECSFASVSPANSTATSGSPSSGTPRGQDPQARRFEPRVFSNGGRQQTFRLATSKRVQRAPRNEPADSPAESSPSDGISIADLRLFHHYSISTCFTLTEDNDPNGVMQKHIAQWGMDFPSILHLILALAAWHLAYLTPESRDSYITQAENHFTSGVRIVTRELSNFNVDNCQKIYMSAVLVCLAYFARGPQPGEYLIFSDSGISEWQRLLRGVKVIVTTYRQEVFSGVLAPGEAEESGAMSESLCVELREHTEEVKTLGQFVMQNINTQPNRSMYQSAIDDLLMIMQDVYKKRVVNDPGVGLMPSLMGWLYRLPDGFVCLLEQKEPFSLMILSHWAVILRYMESVWFMEGWSQHVLRGISANLSADFQPHISWPIQRINGN
ncbi:Fungal Zn(2)-Cys(6) binuclear cluster domain-containing protein [Penicillium ucsense]|uniref:Fungal Zn(2)-Cys(6) binuclear cluster domain-containing protein n=1 Tax=Penicillium ucsense TaxID=2839758 RepID=A0A8J8W5N5_9EURO|nr:Fungal Zn(2)-Cys(6) binuclear cluster domain-containing protein [Penicillium ucsense]KAF7736985.1 Fungal Zn(2)-Cys(6) binuclear cluster domain-containing protein [Penicillium ucsense]